MSKDPDQQVLRLRKKHLPGQHSTPVAADGARILEAQSLRHALMAGVIVIVVFAAIWSMFSTAFGRIFPWMTMLLGVMVGYAVRRAGQGVDWRFPTAAGLLGFVGSLVGNAVLAADTTAREFGVGTLEVLRSVTIYTWPYFFSEAMSPADWAFALFAAGIAAFYANRRLNRREYQALRMWHEENDND